MKTREQLAEEYANEIHGVLTTSNQEEWGDTHTQFLAGFDKRGELDTEIAEQWRQDACSEMDSSAEETACVIRDEIKKLGEK